MPKPIFNLMYMPPTAFWSLWKQEGHIHIEAVDNYQKASFRNRTHIAAPTGHLTLSIPLLKGKNSQMPYQKVLIDNRQPWQRNHWRAITSAYGKSPFFEHYQDALIPLFERKRSYLFDFNLDAFLVLKNLLQFDNQTFILSETYDTYPQNKDFRNKIRPNRDINLKFVEYVQVFADKTGFAPNLSALDLLFCMGPEAQRYL